MGEDEYLTPTEVAEKLKIHERTVRRLLADGVLPGVRIGAKVWRISAAALRAYVEAGGQPAIQTTGTASPAPAENTKRDGHKPPAPKKPPAEKKPKGK